jgi:hypothetical protein
LKLFVSLFVCLFLFVYLFFPFSLPALLSLSSHPSILNITIVIIKARKYLIAHSARTIAILKAMMGRQKKTGKPVSPEQKISTGTRGK